MTEKIGIVRVTPALATEWLEGNVALNRRLIPNLVTFYAAEMRAGKWRVNGESIKFSKSGALMDGQHRLHAIIKVNQSIPMVVVRELDQ